MKWNEFSDTLLVREILVVEPYQYPTKSKERGNAWTAIATNLQQMLEPGSQVSQRSARDRFNLLVTKHKTKQRVEVAAASGISPEVTELDLALDDILERVAEASAAQEQVAEEKKYIDQLDKQNAEELRQRSLETFSESRKRAAGGSPSTTKKKRSRSTGSDVMAYLRENKSQKEKETELRERQLDAYSKTQSDMMNLLQQQMSEQREQQHQMIQQQQLQANLQQQQMNAFLSIMAKFAEK